MMKAIVAITGIVFLLFSTLTPAADRLTIMFPASADLSNVSAFQIAKYKHYYSDAGLDVDFLPGQGGVYTGRQVAAGKADMGVVFGDTAIVLRSKGLPIRMLALLGAKGPMVLAANVQSGVRSLKDLRGKSISILSREDSTYYILLAALASVNLKEKDVNLRVLGGPGVIRDFISGDVQVCACIPDWVVLAEDAGVKMNQIHVSDYLPTLPQAIVTSDQFLSDHPDLARRFVQATLKAFVELRDEPAESAKVYADAIPSHRGQEAALTRVYDYYQYGWSGQKIAGMMDPQTIARLQDIYFNLRIISKKSRVDRIYTNEFISAGK